MQISTAECEARLTKALGKFHTYNDTVFILKIANKHKVNHNTLTNQINSKRGSITSNSGLNRLLAVA
jgi:hypothetical protein